MSENLAYLWLFPDYGAGVILATAFSDLVQAEVHEPDGTVRRLTHHEATGRETDR